MTTKEIRDRLMRKRVEYEAALEAVKVACNEITELKKKITDEDVQVLRSHGVDVQCILDIDVERCKVEQDYLDETKAKLSFVITKLHEILEGEFNV